MYRQARSLEWLMVLVLGVVPCGRSAAPPVPTGKLDPQQQKALEAVKDELASAVLSGRLTEAARRAKEEEALRCRWQGAGYWETLDARYAVERWQRLARLKESAQKQMALALRRGLEGTVLAEQGKHAEAEKAYRESLDQVRALLGEEHAETAFGYNHLATQLEGMGRYGQAQPLFEKALSLRQKLLRDHPDTATSYNNLALNLQYQGKHQEADRLHHQALQLRRTLLGEQHPDTATTYGNRAYNLDALGKHAEARALHLRALELYKTLLGETHPHVAIAYSNLAGNLQYQGKHAEAEPYFRLALEQSKRLHGEEHPVTASGYVNLASNLAAQAKYAEAEPLHQKGLHLRRTLFGEDHPQVAQSYNNLGYVANARGRYAQAEALFHRGLQLSQKTLGESHPFTAACYNNVAYNLEGQGKLIEAQLHYEKALKLTLKIRGEDHPDVARSYNNLAHNLDLQRKHALAHSYYVKALALHKKLLGDDHPHTARGYNNLAFNLHYLGNDDEAERLFRKALDLRRKRLTDRHPDTVQSLNNLASNLASQKKYTQAEPLYRQALDLHRDLLGEEHPLTAASYNNLALNLYDQGKAREAIRAWHAAVLGYEAAALVRARSGFERALARLTTSTPREGLVIAHANRKEFGPAWVHAEANLARGLLDDVAGSLTEDATLVARMAQVDTRLLPLLDLRDPAEEQVRLRDDLRRQRRDLQMRLAKDLADRSAKRIWDVYRIQQQLPDDAALVLWVGAVGENWGCVLRSQGQPRWQRLLGTGPKEGWTDDDYRLPTRLHRALADPGSSRRRRADLIAAMRERWFDPLRPHLQAEGKLPAVRRLFVVPVGDVAAVPVEVIAPEYVISYTPSGTVLGQRLAAHRRLEATSVLALGDPVFAVGKRDREGAPLVEWQPLPGTRVEVAALRRLFGERCSVLTGSAASEQKLDELLRTGELRKCRILHLATHGTIDLDYPERSALILARDRLPTPREQADRVAKGLTAYTGELRVETILREWKDKLNCDLVVLSACQTGLGRSTSGDGLLGFAYALHLAGARSIVLSRWKVDDTATALLMVRFYENLLGQRTGSGKPLPRAEALAEAKAWLRELPRKDAEALARALADGARGKTAPLNSTEKPKPIDLPSGTRPFEHPYYWAAFTLIGDPN